MLHPWKLREAVRTFEAGGLIAYPTEAIYGLGCDPLDPNAVMRILDLKKRPAEKGLILIAADYAQVKPFIAPLDAETRQHICAAQPVPTTWLLPAAKHLPYWLTGAHTSIAVRVTDHPIAAALCRACGSPLVSTSANPAGLSPARNTLTVRRLFGDQVECIIAGATGGNRNPSRIIDAASGQVLRG